MTTPPEISATPALPSRTTSPATSPNLTRTLAFAVLNRDINGVLKALAWGASMDEENDAIEVIHDRIFCDLTAVSLAVLVDAATDSVLMTPLVLNHGGRIDQVDSRGRVLLDFASSEAVCTYLHQHGAPEPVALDADPPVAATDGAGIPVADRGQSQNGPRHGPSRLFQANRRGAGRERGRT
ncbi:hypothetical protein [Luteibacter sp. CQ10]|uniref:hypothetical protein n=1 Tax=Luteibacter sp. CQ10 TaxID=2805821 RepID=UPI0034A0F5FD